MEQNQGSSSMQLCRMCGICGHHDIDIWNDHAHLENTTGNRGALKEKIFTCSGIRVKRYGKMPTKICRKCFDKINDFAISREMWIATNHQFRIMVGEVDEMDDDAVDVPHAVQGDNDGIANSPDDDDFGWNGGEFRQRKTSVPMKSLAVDAHDILPYAVILERIETDRTPLSSDEHTEIAFDSMHCEEYVQLVATSSQLADDAASSHHLNAGGVKIELGEDRTDSNTVKTMTHSAAKNDPYSASRIRNRLHLNSAKCSNRFVVKCRCPHVGKCREAFENWDAMMYHVATYHAKGIKRKFSCHLCKKTSTYRKDLQKHMDAVHIGLRRFKCPFPKCLMAFAQKGVLQRHTNAIHAKEIEFKCTECPAKFYLKSLLTRHSANKHGQGITYSCLSGTL